MSTSAWVPGPIWQPGMSIEQESSAAVKSKVELLASIGLWAKSWGKSLINLLAASFGSWTTALLIEGGRPPTAYVTVAQPHPHSYTGPRQLAQPGRNLFLDRSEKDPHAQRLLIS